MSENTKTIIGWHFVGHQLRDGSPIPEDGEWWRVDGKMRLYAPGLHASRDPFDALQYAPGSTLCLVELREDLTEAPENDTMVARERRILARRDMSRELRTFACKCVRETPLRDGRTVWALLRDKRSRRAVEVAESYADGNATAEELAAAENAAWYALVAAGSAEWYAAWAAVKASAEDVPRAAVCDTTQIAVGEVAWAEARDAAEAAATAWHRKLFREVVRAAFSDVSAAAAVLDELDKTGL